MSLAGREHRRRIRIVLLALSIAATAAFGLAPSTALAKPGDLDRSFGKNGRVLIGPLPVWNPFAPLAMASLSDGRTVIGVGETLRAYLASGRPDRSFGEGGSTTLGEPAGSHFVFEDLTVDGNGRILVAGTVIFPAATRPEAHGFAAEYAFVARYLANGRIDSRFGTDGMVLTDFGLPPPEENSHSYGGPQVRISGIAADARGRIVLTGTRGAYPVFPDPKFAVEPFLEPEAFVARLDMAGTLDPSFRRAGIVTLPRTREIGEPTLADGKIYFRTLVTGSGIPRARRYVVRLAPNGAPDPHFGTGGRVKTPYATAELSSAIAVDSHGRLLLFGGGRVPYAGKARSAGTFLSVSTVERLEPDGKLDRSFGHEGVTKIVSPGWSVSPSALTLDSSGRILLAGISSPLIARKDTPTQRFALIRLGRRGHLDKRFGDRGEVTTGFGATASIGQALLIDGHGRAVVGGVLAMQSFESHSQKFALVRYELGR
jgi:uncharacterized delta-60 repeat protein